MATKLYPFSLRNYHSIEFYHDYLFSTMMELEEKNEQDSERYRRIYNMYWGDLTKLLTDINSSNSNGVAFLAGYQIGLAKKIISWASENRARILFENNKNEYMQYC